jgi:hypothetical protein
MTAYLSSTQGARCTQYTSIDGNYIGGYFIVASSKLLPSDVSAAGMKTALQALQGFGSVSVSRTEGDNQGGYTWTVTWLTAPGLQPKLTFSNSLTGSGTAITGRRLTAGNSLGGTYQLDYKGKLTVPLLFNASAEDVQTALLPVVSGTTVFRGPVTSEGGSEYRITFTGLTGDTYKKDESATCKAFPDHVPPVSDCECGFYAYSDIEEAKFEGSINPGAFLLDVDLYGVGFKYARGYRAETQVVNELITPSRCQFCRILPAKVFVTTYKLGYDDISWWQWQIRCVICSSSFKDEDKLSIDQMSASLKLLIS